jgi:hypothetical protein
MPSFNGYGGISLSGNASSDLKYVFYQPILWDTKNSLVIEKEFLWNSGPVEDFWWRVTGCCRRLASNDDGINGGCDNLPIGDNSCNLPSTFVMNVAASNLSDLCDTLRATKWMWPICEIQRFSKPVRSASSSTDDCNELTIVEDYCLIPECFEFCLYTDGLSKCGVTTEILDFYTLIKGYGGLTLSGKAESRIIWPIYYGEGGITLSGSAEVKSSHYSFAGYGGISLSGSANISSGYWSTQGYGGITLSGRCNSLAPNYHAAITGGITLSGNANSSYKISTEGYGGITLSGSAYYPFRVTNITGGITLSGSAVSNIKSYRFSGYGEVVFGGNSLQTSPDWHTEGYGGITLSGSAESNQVNYLFNGDGGITLSGSAESRDSSSGNFWFVPYGGITLSGSAESNIKSYRFSGYGEVVFGGGGDVTPTFIGDYISDVGGNSFLEDILVTLNEAPLPIIELAPKRISVNCSKCTPMPDLLYLSHNLENANVFLGFLNQNGLEIEDRLSMRYSKKSSSWISNLHFTGYANGSSTLENWRFLFDWSCTNLLGEEESGSYFWKFSMYVNRKNVSSSVDFDTKLLITFPSDICPVNDLFDFSFLYNTQRNFVKTNPSFYVDVYTLYDNIGLFNSNYWSKNPNLNFYITEGVANNAFESKNLDFLIK